MVPSERTVTVAVGHGKKAARNIDAWLKGKTYTRSPKSTSSPPSTSSTPGITPTRRRRCGPRSTSCGANDLRRSGAGLDETNALYEARRCLSCGNCFECDNCYGVCPDNAVIKLGPRQALQVRLRLLQGLRGVRARMSLRSHRDGAGRNVRTRAAKKRLTILLNS